MKNRPLKCSPIQVLLRLIEEVAIEQPREGCEDQAQRNERDDQESKDQASPKAGKDVWNEAPHQRSASAVM